MLKLCFLLALGAAHTLAEAQNRPNPFHVIFQWNYVNYTWPSPKYYERAKDKGFYVPGNSVITGMKVFKNRIYLAIPRLKRGIPVTLASISATPIDANTSPLLEPFPSWFFQSEGMCSALQSVQNMEIDPKGRMWVLDNGRVMDGSEESTRTPCGASLRIFDLENYGSLPNRELRRFDIPVTVADPRTADLHDIVLDHEDGGMAYISDADPMKPGIIVFSLRNETFWKVSHKSMFANPEGAYYDIDNQRLPLIGNIHALAIVPASTQLERSVFYAPLSSLHIYYISTSALKNKTSQADVDSHVKLLGGMLGQTDSMIMTNDGVMLFSDMTNATIMVWDISLRYRLETSRKLSMRDPNLLQWPASFAFDNDGSAWVLSNRMHLALNNSMRIDEPNFRVLAANASNANYQYRENGTVPYLPEISTNSDAGLLSFNASLVLVALLTYFMF